VQEENYMREAVEKVLNEYVRPRLVADGGDVELIDVDETRGIVRIRLMGSCASCPMSGLTFLGLVETTLKKRVPGVKIVEPMM
jgi:Fe-S cluster biogenesis protein NfuA